MGINELLENRLSEARIAENEWRALRNELELDSKYRPKIVLFPKEDDLIYDCGLKYLDTYKRRQDIGFLCVLYSEIYIEQNINNYSTKTDCLKRLSDEEINRLITLYSLYPMDNEITVVSADKPYMRKGSSILGINGVDMEELIAVGVYGIIPFKKII